MSIFSKSRETLHYLLVLCKFWISLAITGSALAGVLVVSDKFSIVILYTLVGVFLLSCSASVFNQILESKFDSKMPRTKNRPIPSGKIKKTTAFIIGVLIMCVGFLVLTFEVNYLCAFTGMFNLLWYVLVYTPLKQKSVWAVFTGAITGTLPFFMGYFSVLPHWPSFQANLIAAFLFAWQIPHFMVLLKKYGQEFENAGFITIYSEISTLAYNRILYLWIIACSSGMLALPMFKIITLPILISGTLFFGFSMCIFAVVYFFRSTLTPPFLYIGTNMLQGIYLLLLIVEYGWKLFA